VCVDDADFPDIDDGCVQTTPVCVEKGAITGGSAAIVRLCAVCEDDQVLDGATDEGCIASKPICNEAVPGGRCDECNDDVDCGGGGEVCDTDQGLCVPCLDNHGPGEIDLGCKGDLPVCLVSGSGPEDSRCVECQVDADCGPLERCDETAQCVDTGATVAVDDAYSTRAGVRLEVLDAAAGVIANDQYPTGSVLVASVKGGTGPSTSQGTLTLSANGTFTFHPAPGYAGTVTFTYTLLNTLNGDSDEAQVVIIVYGPPRAVDDQVSTPEDTPVTFDPRANDTHPNGSALTLTRIVTAPAHGTDPDRSPIEAGARRHEWHARSAFHGVQAVP
jgi:hypothetical protein